MVWKYSPGDNYDLYQLEGFKRFFESDLTAAETSLAYVRSFEKFGLPGYRWTLLAAEMAVEDARANLKVVEKAIKEHKERDK